MKDSQQNDIEEGQPSDVVEDKQNILSEIVLGDCRATMRQWAADGVKVQMCVTSPPYYGLRDYGHDGQLGLEETPEQYIANMVEVFACVWDILDDDGTLWVNLGDSYSAGGRGGGKEGGIQAGNKGSTTGKVLGTWKVDGFRPKNLLGIPWRVAIALQEAGWNLRQDIIWHKPNPMPESVTDRCTKAHEYIFLLSKSQKYFYDHEAIKEPIQDATALRMLRGVSDSHKNVNGAPGQTAHSMNKPRANVRKEFESSMGGGGTSFVGHSGYKRADGTLMIKETRNKRSVWTVNTKPYKGAHFAVFPEELIKPCILAGTSHVGHCPKCNTRWSRDVEKVVSTSTDCPKTQSAHEARGGTGTPTGTVGKSGGGRVNGYTTTLGWKANCECGVEPVSDIVLDPFMGSGTTAQVSQQLDRRYLGCELNPDYTPLQNKRVGQIPAVVPPTTDTVDVQTEE